MRPETFVLQLDRGSLDPVFFSLALLISERYPARALESRSPFAFEGVDALLEPLDLPRRLFERRCDVLKRNARRLDVFGSEVDTGAVEAWGKLSACQQVGDERDGAR